MKTTGYACDRCATFQTGSELPPGWLKLSVVLNGGQEGVDAKELCSNYCLASLAVERTEADGRPLKRKSPTSKGTGKHRYNSPESLASARLNAARTTHTVHHVGKNVVKENCQFCDDLTS